MMMKFWKLISRAQSNFRIEKINCAICITHYTLYVYAKFHQNHIFQNKLPFLKEGNK